MQAAGDKLEEIKNLLDRVTLNGYAGIKAVSGVWGYNVAYEVRRRGGTCQG